MSIQVHWLGHCGPGAQLLSSSTEPEQADRRLGAQLTSVTLHNYEEVIFYTWWFSKSVVKFHILSISSSIG